MYVTLNNIIAEKTIDLSYSIKGGAEVAVVSLFSDNIQYEFESRLSLPGKMIEACTYTRRELIDHMEGKFPMTHFDKNKTNKLKDITEIVLSLNELDNTDNLENGKPSRTLLTYHVTSDDDNFTNFVPSYPQYKKLKDEEFINSLTLTVTHKKSNVVTNGPKTTVVLHVK